MRCDLRAAALYDPRCFDFGVHGQQAVQSEGELLGPSSEVPQLAPVHKGDGQHRVRKPRLQQEEAVADQQPQRADDLHGRNPRERDLVLGGVLHFDHQDLKPSLLLFLPALQEEGAVKERRAVQYLLQDLRGGQAQVRDADLAVRLLRQSLGDSLRRGSRKDRGHGGA
jgi:hypothetical protein